MTSAEQIENSFGFHPATEETKDQHAAIRELFIEFTKEVLNRLPESREYSLVRTNLETAAMWAHKAIAMQDPLG